MATSYTTTKLSHKCKSYATVWMFTEGRMACSALLRQCHADCKAISSIKSPPGQVKSKTPTRPGEKLTRPGKKIRQTGKHSAGKVKIPPGKVKFPPPEKAKIPPDKAKFHRA